MSSRIKIDPINLVIIEIIVIAFIGLILYKFWGEQIDAAMLAFAEWWK